jgi:hypothetical protein
MDSIFEGGSAAAASAGEVDVEVLKAAVYAVPVAFGLHAGTG